MRNGFVLAITAFFVAIPVAGFARIQQDEEVPPRYDVNAIPTNYPQDSPKAALQSMLKALDRGRVDYLAAHLLDPQYVDARLKSTGQTFDQFVAAIRRKFKEDAVGVKRLRRFAREGEVVEMADSAEVQLPDVPDQKVFLKKIKDRWFIQNKKEEDKKP